MEKTYTITEKQIMEWYSEADLTWKEQIKLWWPDAFKGSDKVGKWVKSPRNNQLYFIEKLINDESNPVVCYGFKSDGNWVESDNRYRRILDWPIADDSVVKEALIKEAKKRGFVEGVEYSYPNMPELGTRLVKGSFLYSKDFNSIYCSRTAENIFQNGQWATIAAKEMTKEEIETALGFKIKIV